jgi:hypothetical protein
MSSPEDQNILEEAFKRDPKPGNLDSDSIWQFAFADMKFRQKVTFGARQ